MIIDNELWFIERLFMEDIPWTILTQFYAQSCYRLDERLYYQYKNVNLVSNAPQTRNNYDRLKILPMIFDEAKKHGFYDEYRVILEFAFMRRYYAYTLPVLRNTMNVIELNRLQEMSLYMKRNMPDYCNNPFFGEILLVNQVMMQLMDIDSELAYEYINIIG